MMLTWLCATTLAASPLATFKDWVVGCDNLRRCTAIGQVPAGREDAYLVVQRSPGAAANVVVRVRGDERAPAPSLSITIDQRPFIAQRSATKEWNLATIELTRAEVDTLLGRLRRSESLEVSGADERRISLRGAVAAMSYMDEIQKDGAAVPASLPVVRLVRPSPNKKPNAKLAAKIMDVRTTTNGRFTSVRMQNLVIGINAPTFTDAEWSEFCDLCLDETTRDGATAVHGMLIIAKQPATAAQRKRMSAAAAGARELKRIALVDTTGSMGTGFFVWALGLFQGQTETKTFKPESFDTALGWLRQTVEFDIAEAKTEIPRAARAGYGPDLFR